MATQVLRVTKIKSVAAMAGLMRHDTRVDTPEWADPQKAEKNTLYGFSEVDGKPVKMPAVTPMTPSQATKNYGQLMEKYRKLLPEKNRKNAVYGIDVILTSDYIGMQELVMRKGKRMDWLQANVDWLAATFGGKQNIVSFCVHEDEGTPHIHAKIIPLKDGQLKASAFLAGSKYTLSKLQDNYHKMVASKFGFDRGEVGSTRKHIEVSDHHKNAERELRNEIKRMTRENVKLKRENQELKTRLSTYEKSKTLPLPRQRGQERA